MIIVPIKEDDVKFGGAQHACSVMARADEHCHAEEATATRCVQNSVVQITVTNVQTAIMRWRRSIRCAPADEGDDRGHESNFNK